MFPSFGGILFVSRSNRLDHIPDVVESASISLSQTQEHVSVNFSEILIHILSVKWNKLLH